MEHTTIQISANVKNFLDRVKLYERESYNEIIERIMEDDMELNQKTKKEIEERRKEKSVSHEKVKKRLGF